MNNDSYILIMTNNAQFDQPSAGSNNNSETIALPSMDEQGLSSAVTTRFGRCPFFTIVKLTNGKIDEVRVVENVAKAAMGGAGPVAAQQMSQEKVATVIGGNYGPNASRALNQAGISTFGPLEKDGSVKEVLDAYLAGQLPKVS